MISKVTLHRLRHGNKERVLSNIVKKHKNQLNTNLGFFYSFVNCTIKIQITFPGSSLLQLESFYMICSKHNYFFSKLSIKTRNIYKYNNI